MSEVEIWGCTDERTNKRKDQDIEALVRELGLKNRKVPSCSSGLEQTLLTQFLYFQGNEKKIIIFSTVRSKGYGLGFLKDKERFNVAITRAKEVLIVIGDPQVLMQDKNWRELIRYSQKQNSYFKYTV